MKIQFLAIPLTLFSSIAFSSTLLDVTEIVGKTQEQVVNLLDSPTNCSKTKYGTKCAYVQGETEIVFINNKADWITVEGIDNIPFNKEALKSVGIKPANPSFKNDFSMRWDSIQGLKSVSLFKGVTNSDYIYIKAFTE